MEKGERMNEEKFRQFLNPDKGKIGFSIVFYAVAGALPNPLLSLGSFLSYGWPLPIYRVTGVYDSMPPEPIYEISLIALAANAVFWYLIGCKITKLNREKGEKQ